VKPVNTPFGQSAELLFVTVGGTCDYHCVLMSSVKLRFTN
jgi:hypothetical protein